MGSENIIYSRTSICGAYRYSISISPFQMRLFYFVIVHPGLRRTSLPGVIDI